MLERMPYSSTLTTPFEASLHVDVSMTPQSPGPDVRLPCTRLRKRSRSHNQLIPAFDTYALPFNTAPPTTSTQKNQVDVASANSTTHAPNPEYPARRHPRRRASVMLYSTFRVPKESAPEASETGSRRRLQLPFSFARDRQRSNQDEEGKHVGVPATRPPAYFRMATLRLDEPITPRPPRRAPSTDPTQPTPHLEQAAAMSPTRHRRTQIECICEEILHTETTYVDSLRALQRLFFDPLQNFSRTHAIPLSAMTALHTSTTTILNIHDELLCQLQPPTESTSSSTPPDPFGGYTGTLALINQYSTAFLATIEYMKVYSCYCASYLSAKEELALLQCSYPILNEFTMELYDRARADHGVDVISNMIKPVQRICRYPLLFRELLKNATTPEETLILQQSLQKIQAVSTYVNEKVREAQNNARLYELHRSLHPSNKLELLHPSRTLLCETTAGVLNLDPPGWPAKLLWHFRRRRRRESSYKDEPHDTQHRYSSYADDRRGSATVSTSVQTVMSPTSCSSPPSKSTSSASFLLRGRRRSSTGERMRLILLSDMLLMAKRREEQLKIRRQICLSCAVVHDWDDENEAHEHHEEDNRDLAALLSKRCAFTLEVAKIGRCNCQSLSQVTIRRSPRGPLSGLLATRRGSLSFSASAGEVLQYLQREQERNPLARTTKASRGSRSGSRLRGHLESIAGIRAVKRYMVTCETPQRRQEFVTALRQAISRSARIVSIHNAAAEQARSPSLVTGSAMAMAIAVKLPTKIWNSLRHGEITPGAAAGLTACSTGLRRRGSLAITMMPTSTNNSSSVSQLATTEADLLGMEDTPQVRTAEADEKTDTTLV